MLEIDHLALSLPAALAPRAACIARFTAEALAAHGLQGDGRVAQLHAAPLRVNAARGDRAIARQIAGHIARHIEQRTGAAPSPVAEGQAPC